MIKHTRTKLGGGGGYIVKEKTNLNEIFFSLLRNTHTHTHTHTHTQTNKQKTTKNNNNNNPLLIPKRKFGCLPLTNKQVNKKCIYSFTNNGARFVHSNAVACLI